MVIDIIDHDTEQDIKQHFEQCISFIEEGIQSKGIFVHW